MTDVFKKAACLRGWPGTSLARAFRPIAADLEAAQKRLIAVLTSSRDPSVQEVVSYLLGSRGKRIRPALVLFSAGAAGGGSNCSFRARRSSLDVAAAVEIIHMASLVHDDLIDDAPVRHGRPSVHVQWGKRTSVAVGDYLCASALRLVANCEDPRLFAILGPQLCEMCDGEIQQVLDRNDFGLSEPHCLAMVEKKTAALFAACCGAGAATAVSEPALCDALQEFGLHLGIAFQILDDCKDLLGDWRGLGKMPGQDLRAGDVTLPLLYAISCCCQHSREPLQLDQYAPSDMELARVSKAFHSSHAPGRITELVASRVRQAKQAIECIPDSDFKEGLHGLADDVAVATSHILMR